MKKFFISLLTFLWLSISFSSAWLLWWFWRQVQTINWTVNFSYEDNEIVCFTTNNSDCSMSPWQPNWDNKIYWYAFYCMNWDFSISCPSWRSFDFYWNFDAPMMSVEECENQYNLVPLSDLTSCQSSLATATWNLVSCQSDLSSCQLRANQCNVSLESCQESLQNQSCPSTWEILSGYILQSEVTSNYCQVEFWLIDPVNCPASGGTGDVNWSSFFVNNFQVQGARNIYLFMPDFLNWDYTYIDNWNTLNIEVENQGDEDYIQSVIDINSYRPTSEDFTGVFVSGLTLVMPYIVIVLFIIFVRKMIKKIFR